ncbi:MAG: hypothetical protein KF784_15120 [Fimbriimonadaceae bacterium]|nr:hypothetical protein [Fimbriimonadaceae bacterium]
MQYFVLWPDGQRFGPASEDVLQMWAAERRIGPESILVEAPTGKQIRASDLHALKSVFASPSLTPPTVVQGMAPPQPGQPGQWYARPGVPQSTYPNYAQRTSSTETTLAWVFSAIGIICCPLMSIIGIVLAAVGLSKRQSSALGALIFGIISLVASFLWHAVISM